MSEGSTAGHPRHRLDPVIHSPVRLSIVACLAAAERAEFGFVRDTVEVSDSVLSKQVTVLAEAGYVQVRKGYVGKRPRTWLFAHRSRAARLPGARGRADRDRSAARNRHRDHERQESGWCLS
jgi:hypothetical protein